MQYSDYVTEMASLAQYQTSDPFFVQQLPFAIQYATDRINRELNLLNTVTANSSLALTANTRSLAFSSIGMNVITDVNIITPYTTTNPELGTRNPVTICDKSWLNTVYGSATNPGVPVNFAFLDNATLLFGPFPDHPYTVEIIGTVYPQYLSSTQTTTFISLYLPDLLIAAGMVFMAGAQKNFGSQADTPQQAVSWESQYTTLRDSASAEDLRRKFMSAGYISSQLPTPTNPQRT
jgi:hypothetical protein